ncbi:hypothetical protein [Winogradskyella flava]|uniref:Uncharacterized protein n=1 Tax=Winogradskyella flava TaxID=1884876 RepID=A0A842IPT7_9FLAO|nr:hypothetical protein [Winogradskyella flava]MBC2844811.1 hypothetical protein [Winogradskyella flava]
MKRSNMLALILFGFLFVGLMTFVIIRLSISCIFWTYSRPIDKQHVFKLCFPYYIIVLTIMCIGLIMNSDYHPLAMCYFSCVYFMAILTWKYELKSSLKKNQNFAVEPNLSQLP